MICFKNEALTMTTHQQKQKEIINTIEKQVACDALQATVVLPVENFEQDSRICLTSIHFPHKRFVTEVYTSISEPLKKLFPDAYFYSPSSLHLTIKNIRVINNPPRFSKENIKTAIYVFDKVIPIHKAFSIYPYRLLLFKNNLALMNTTDEELDAIILDLNRELECALIPDDKQYVNTEYFFSNMTLARFSGMSPAEFREKVHSISSSLLLPIYKVDSVSLITSNAVMKKLEVHGKWNLKAH